MKKILNYKNILFLIFLTFFTFFIYKKNINNYFGEGILNHKINDFIKQFDIYYINLDKCKKRKEYFNKTTAKINKIYSNYKINRFNAINGNNINNENIDNIHNNCKKKKIKIIKTRSDWLFF